MSNYQSIATVLGTLVAIIFIQSCGSSKVVNPEEPLEVMITNHDGKGPLLEITLVRGKSHNHPLMALWLQDTAGNYIQTLYVSKSIASGIFDHGDKSKGHWQPGPIRRPAALPYWSHKRGIISSDGLYTPSQEHPVPDAYTGPTPQAGFVLKSGADELLPEVFDVLLEINQSWDWNEFWTNNKYPDDIDYFSSSQPSLIYLIRMSSRNIGIESEMKVIGRGHYSGKDGNLYTDLETMTTALHIVESVRVKIKSLND